MKTKTIYSFAAALLLTAGMAIAQTPTPPVQPTPGVNYNTTTPAYGSPINNTSIPDPLRSTLQGTQYKGWENGTMYFNQSTNQYSLQMPAAISTTPAVNPLAPATPAPTTPATPNPMGGLQTQPASPSSPAVAAPVTIYRFDQNGKLIPQSKPDNN